MIIVHPPRLFHLYSYDYLIDWSTLHPLQRKKNNILFYIGNLSPEVEQSFLFLSKVRPANPQWKRTSPSPSTKTNVLLHHRHITTPQIQMAAHVASQTTRFAVYSQKNSWAHLGSPRWASQKIPYILFPFEFLKYRAILIFQLQKYQIKCKLQS